MALNYPGIPTVSQFRKDSNVSLAIRSNDQMLHAMDRSLEKLAQASDDKMALTADLFFTINSWIKLFHEKGRGIEPGRYPAISALSEAVQDELSKMYGVTSRGQLARKLNEIFGAQITSSGSSTDAQFKAMMFTKAARESKRIYFEGGKMKRYTSDLRENVRPGLQLLDSKLFAGPPIARRGAGFSLPGFAPFVMSMEREFYMTKHTVEQGGVFHSAYFNGVVAMAGTMLVENGVLKAIRGDSGHYQPDKYKMVNALRALRARGVNLRGVTVYDYTEDGPTSNARAMGKTGMVKPAMPPIGRPSIVPPRMPPRPGMAQQGQEFYSGDTGFVPGAAYLYNREIAIDAELYMN